MRICNYAFVFVLVLMLMACGGGGGGSSSGASAGIPASDTVSSSVSSSSKSSALSSSISSAITFSSSSASEALTSFLVTTTTNHGGVIVPASNVTPINSMSNFTITPETGYRISAVSGCEGSLKGNVYITGNITSTCSVDVVFALDVKSVPVAPRVIAYVVEQTARDALGNYLEEFSSLIENDTRSTTKVVTVSATTKPADIRKSLQDIDNLWGVFLIGNVPVSHKVIANEYVNYQRIDDSYYRLPRCSYYKQIDDVRFSTPDDGFAMWHDPDCKQGNWVSRIIGRSIDRNDDVVAFVKKDIKLRHSFNLMYGLGPLGKFTSKHLRLIILTYLCYISTVCSISQIKSLRLMFLVITLQKCFNILRIASPLFQRYVRYLSMVMVLVFR